MDDDECHNHQKQPAVEMFVTTAMKENELLEYCSRTMEILCAEKDPGNTYRVDGDRPREPAHRPRSPLEAFREPHPFPMNEKSGSM